MFRILDACLGLRVRLVSMFVHQAARLSVHTMLVYSFAEALAESYCRIPIVELCCYLWPAIAKQVQTIFVTSIVPSRVDAIKVNYFSCF
jgi:hypothetical protein